MKAFIIHGTNGNSKENWFPWLKEELEKANIETIAPDFPTGDMQSLDSWLKTFQPYTGRIDSDCIFVGHSLGPAFILSLLERIDTRIHAAFLVAPFVTMLGIEQFDSDRIRTNCADFTVYASDNDPYVSLERSRFVADHTGAKFKVVHGAGHFNAAAGYTKFEQLLEDIKGTVR